MIFPVKKARITKR